jgi:hypothetical protein
MTVVLQDWPTQALKVLFAFNLYDREVKKWIPKSRIVQQFVKESGKPWDTWVQIGNKIGTKQGYWDSLKYRPVRIHVVHKDSEDEDEKKDKDENEDEFKNGCPRYGSCILCGHIGMYVNYCEQWECESTGAICVDPVDGIKEDEGWN